MTKNWTATDYSIFVQSLCRHWIGPDDTVVMVDQKLKFCLKMAREELPRMTGQPSAGKPPLSKPAETKIINAMEEHIASNDLGGVWEVWNELDEDEKNHMNNCIDRNRRSRWKKAITAAGMMILNSDAPEPTFPEDFG